ncbi:MAG: MCE family protein [Candidatus Omnitrophica bacterium]|nr:MCE family protein [Candidatus Omnitrophota bacterium]
MSKKANKTIIGVFTAGALILLIIGIVVFGSGMLFKKTNEFVLYFDGSVKGLSVGAPVMFRGVSIGTVKDISLIYDSKAGTIMLPVIIEIEQGRIEGTPSFGEAGADKKLIELGLRAKLEVRSFLTGELMIAFDLYPDSPAQLRNIQKAYPELPTLSTSPDIFAIMEQLPIKEIANNVKTATQGIDRLVNSSDLQNMFTEIKQAMLSFRLLNEYLEQHPEAFLKGKSADSQR